MTVDKLINTEGITMKYSRESFRVWLEALPEKPFCTDNNCPISQFLGLKGGRGVRYDSRVAYAIDDSMPDLDTDLFWDRLLPSDVLRVMESLEEAS